MKISLKDIVWSVYLVYLVTIIIWSERVAYTKYSNFTFIVLIGVMGFYIVQSKHAIPIRAFAFFPFMFFSFFSIIWSKAPQATIVRSITLARLSVLIVVLALYLYVSGDCKRFIYGISVASIFIIIYLLYFYGFSGLVQIMDDRVRLGRGILNQNTLAIYISISAILFLNQFLMKRRIHFLILAIGLIVIVIMTGSKKGVLDLVIGGIFLARKGFNEKRITGKYATRAFRLILLACVMYLVWQLPVFAITRNRLELMFEELSGVPVLRDYSTANREIMIKAGLVEFLRHPLLGIGLDASSTIAWNNMVIGSYLHNDYVELLATGGIIGFLIQYVPIFLIFKNTWINRSASETNMLCLFLMIVYFANGIAAVQYVSKICCVILAITLANYMSNIKYIDSR